MKEKEEIVRDWLPRYTGRELTEFGKYILLTNFSQYLDFFSDRFGVPVVGDGLPIQSATSGNLSILNFGMGSPMAATVMDLLSAVEPKAVLCGIAATNAEECEALCRTKPIASVMTRVAMAQSM